MKHVYEGKTKSVYELEDGNYMLKFKDDATGENGVFDPGSNQVGLSIPGAGAAGLKMTEYFFNILKDKGVETHFVSADIDNVTMTVRPAKVYGKGLEVICRFKATGSFIRRYGDYIEEAKDLDAFVEMTLKDDKREDPPITKDALEMLGIFSEGEYDKIKGMMQKTASIIKEEMAKKGMELYDIKLEFGRTNDGVLVIDEISGGNMRVYKDGKILSPLELSALVVKG